MKRLTKSGGSFCTNSDEHDILVELDKDNYEEAVYDLDKVAKMLNRLVEIEDKLESGELVELPYRYGQNVWVVEKEFDYEHDRFTGEWIIRKFNCLGMNNYWGNLQVAEYQFTYYSLGNVFSTQEQAEARLKELKKESKK